MANTQTRRTTLHLRTRILVEILFTCSVTGVRRHRYATPSTAGSIYARVCCAANTAHEGKTLHARSAPITFRHRLLRPTSEIVPSVVSITSRSPALRDLASVELEVITASGSWVPECSDCNLYLRARRAWRSKLWACLHIIKFDKHCGTCGEGAQANHLLVVTACANASLDIPVPWFERAFECRRMTGDEPELSSRGSKVSNTHT